MIILHDEIEIAASPERIFDWFAHFRENYLDWHPDHVDCQYLEGKSILNEGAVVYCEEYLHGKLHKLKLRLTNLETNRRLEYVVAPGMGGSFVLEPRGEQTAFIAYLYFGIDFPLIGPLLDRMMGAALADQIAAFRQHMMEEGENLKRLLEAKTHTLGSDLHE